MFPEFKTGLAAEMGKIEFSALGIDECIPAQSKYGMKSFGISAVHQRPDIFYNLFLEFGLCKFNYPVDSDPPAVGYGAILSRPVQLSFMDKW